VLAVKCSVLEGDQGAVCYLEVDGFLREEGVEIAVHLEVLWDAAVGGVVAVDEDLDGGAVGEIEGERGVGGREAGALESPSNELRWVDSKAWV
jgi:hypothetical protein